MCDISEKEGSSLSHEAAKVVTGHFYDSLNHSSPSSNQNLQHLYGNHDLHWIPSVLHNGEAYESEQYDLKVEAKVLRQEIETQEQQNQNLEQFIQRVRKYAELTELTPYAAHELIKAIYVGAPDKSSGKRRQSIHISYDLIGFIPLSELMTQGMAWPEDHAIPENYKTVLWGPPFAGLRFCQGR